MTRAAVAVVFSAMQIATAAYDIELLVITAQADIAVRTAKIDAEDVYRYTTTASDRFDQACDAPLVGECRPPEEGKPRPVIELRPA
jgi:hypothetical protein